MIENMTIYVVPSNRNSIFTRKILRKLIHKSMKENLKTFNFRIDSGKYCGIHLWNVENGVLVSVLNKINTLNKKCKLRIMIFDTVSKEEFNIIKNNCKVPFSIKGYMSEDINSISK